MKTFLIRGLPNSVQMDGWWMSTTPEPKGQRQRDAQTPIMPRVVGLVSLVALGDIFLWQAKPGLSLALFGLAALLVLWLINGRRGTGAFGFALLAFLPLIEYAQPLAFGFFFVGFLLAVVWLALGGWPGVSRLITAFWQFLNIAPPAAFDEAKALTRQLLPTANAVSGRSFVQGWFVPLGLGLIFASLLISANPMMGNWLSDATQARWLTIELFIRVLFWAGLVIVLLPILLSPSFKERLKLAPAPLVAPPVPAALNTSSVCRSLILFNLMFAVQTALDLTYLWGGAGLPDGMSFAQYAHRGAYPLLATALMAGVFALIARPFTSGSAALRVALLVWVGQNIFLVLSSLLRLELYVAQYGLTYLRLAAFIWMAVVALGLGLVVYQTLKDKPAVWLLGRAALLGVSTLYAASFLNFPAIIAQHNLNQSELHDPNYICGLGPHALPAINAYEARSRSFLCYRHKPRYIKAADWREWGFRDWRLQRSLSASTRGDI